MSTYLQRRSLSVDAVLCRFIENEALPNTNVQASEFWRDLEELLSTAGAENERLLLNRDRLQAQIDAWNREHGLKTAPHKQYKQLLREIGYVVPEPADFRITTQEVDVEIATRAGPQLVVPVSNSRFALNAANARWGSLYDALYGTDAIPEDDATKRTVEYNAKRGAAVISAGRDLLDKAAPLIGASHKDALQYSINGNELLVRVQKNRIARLAEPQKLVGYRGEPARPEAILLVNNGLHLEIAIDPRSRIGSADRAGVRDIILEAAITVIQDCEDSVAAVNAVEKASVYRNWLGLMLGTLEATFERSGETITRRLSNDRKYVAPGGKPFSLPGRSLLLVRNVGLHMRTDAILSAGRQPVFEGIVDAVITSLIGLHDLLGNGHFRNSRVGSIYIVKPKLHGPEEVAFADKLFGRIEKMLSLSKGTLKMGVMDEERRTTVNLPACVHAARERIVFINTGFLDRTGDEIHTSMELGPMVPKEAMKQQAWFKAYEDWNVDVGLKCGFSGKAQIGKGMWPAPNMMAEMLSTKIEHPRAGATTAWVPSPVAAVLHAMHYHRVDVYGRHGELRNRRRASLDDVLSAPVLKRGYKLSSDEIQQELDNNIQGLLGYVIRWIDEGIGCSKIPDINNIGLMEDRATLRISSQHVCNWLYHGLCTAEQVMATLRRMALVVDKQSRTSRQYRPIGYDVEKSLAFQAAHDLIFKGREHPNGYTEPVLHYYHRLAKTRDRQGDTKEEEKSPQLD